MEEEESQKSGRLSRGQTEQELPFSSSTSLSFLFAFAFDSHTCILCDGGAS